MVLTQIQLTKIEMLKVKLFDSYAWHRALWHAFPDKDRQTRQFLFRVNGGRTQAKVLVLSPDKPEIQPWGSWQMKSIPAGFLLHSGYHFQLKANPTFRRAIDKRRIGIYKENELAKWILRKSEKNGFSIIPDSLRIASPIDESFIKNKKRGKHTSVDFSGILNVTNRQDFQNAFRQGIGSGKSFGYGLLLIKPIK